MVEARGAASAPGASTKGARGLGVIAESGVGGAEFKFVATSKDAGGLVIAKAAPNTSPAGLASSAGEAVAAPKSNTAGEEAG